MTSHTGKCICCKPSPHSPIMSRATEAGPLRRCLIESSGGQICRLTEVARTLPASVCQQASASHSNPRIRQLLNVTSLLASSHTIRNRLSTLKCTLQESVKNWQAYFPRLLFGPAVLTLQQQICGAQHLLTKDKVNGANVSIFLPTETRRPSAFPVWCSPAFPPFAQVLAGSDQPRFLPNRPIGKPNQSSRLHCIAPQPPACSPNRPSPRTLRILVSHLPFSDSAFADASRTSVDL